MIINYNNLRNIVILSIITFIGILIHYLINIGNKHVNEKNMIKIDYKKFLPYIYIGMIYIIYKVLSNKFPIISDTLGMLITAIILAYLFNPLVDKLEKKNIKRKYGVIIIYILILIIFIILGFSVIPKTGRELSKLFNNFPSYIDKWSGTVEMVYEKYYLNIDNMPEIFKTAQKTIIDNVNNIQIFLINGISRIFSGVTNTLSKLIGIVLVPILTFYFIKDKEYFKKRIINIIPENKKEEVLDLSRKIDKSLGLFVRGRLFLAMYVGIATMILLLILKVEFAIVIGLITGIADIIPYIGPFLGFLPAVFFAFISSPTKAIWVSLIFLLIQWVENNVLAPKVIGQTTGIHPLIILLSLIVGGGMFGVLGMIFSVPAVAVGKIVFDHFYKKYKDNKIN